jgi:hypothetical protein
MAERLTLTHPAFGDLAPCPRCGGRGELRHKADPAETRERARRRRRGELVDEPPAMDACPRCLGAGFLEVTAVDEGSSEPPPDGLWALSPAEQ